MAVQDALILIQKLREAGKVDLKLTRNFDDLVHIANENNLTCSTADLKKAFVLDWKMRWAKFNNQA